MKEGRPFSRRIHNFYHRPGFVSQRLVARTCVFSQGIPRGCVLRVAVPDGARPLAVLAVEIPPNTPPQGGEGRVARVGQRTGRYGRPLVR